MSEAEREPAPFEALEPWDEHNRRLASNVHPAEWVNPRPTGRYHMVVIGAGTAGLVTAAIASALGARVALIERRLMGGDCLNVGCVPSKALLEGARRAGGGEEFGGVMERMRRIRAEISEHDSAARFAHLGVDVYLGDARFVDDRRVEVEGTVLEFRRAVIATGSRAALPPIPGIETVGARTNETIFSLTRPPARLVVIGGGAIGCELGQAFAAFGTEVTLLEAGDRILPNEDPEAAMLVREAIERSGVTIETGIEVRRAERRGQEVVVTVGGGGGERSIACDGVLVATGRAPNVERLGLDRAGVVFDGRGIAVDDRLRTDNPRIYAIGDVVSAAKFTHVADAHARLVVRNALFHGRGRASDLVIPWCTYTSPELAHVGRPYGEVAGDADVEAITVPFSSVDRARLDGETDGFLRVYVTKGSDRIVAATLVGAGAGEVISQLTLAMTAGIGLSKVSETIFPYPTRAEIVRKVADSWGRRRLTPTVSRAFETFFRWVR